ncbi:MAG: ATP-dependent helicase [Actinomycetales bacterium]|nr:ATP-dependent helicase [Actinomycetales bacterium]
MTELPINKARFRLGSHQAKSGAELTLTRAQSVVEAFSGEEHRLVYGAPATGKSEAAKRLALRLARQNGAASVLVLAANRESANRLRDEIALAFQGATPGPLARTISSLAFSVLRQAALTEGFREPELISGPEQDRILKSILEPYVVRGNSEFASVDFTERTAALAALGFPKYVTAQVASLRGFRAELRDLIAVCQENRISPERLAELGTEHGIDIWAGAAAIYSSYMNRLREPQFENRHDSSTLLNVAYDSLISEDAAFDSVLGQLRTLIVDDAQELTQGGARLLQAIAGRGVAVVLLGDPDAAVLGFRASDPRAMRELYNQLGAVHEPVILDALEAANPEIRAAMSRVSNKINTELAGPQRAANARLAVDPNVAASGDLATAVDQAESLVDETPQDCSGDLAGGGSVEVRVHDNSASESAWLAHRLRQLHLHDGIAWRDIAVVGRSREVLNAFEAELAAENIPVLLQGARSALKDEFASRELLQLAKFAVSAHQLTIEEVVGFLSGPYCGLDSLALRRLRRVLRRQELEAGGNRTAEDLLLEIFSAPGSAVTIGTPEGHALSDFVRSIFETRNLASEGATVDQLLWQLWSGSKAKNRWVAQSRGLGEVAVQANRNLDALVALFAAANRFVERNPQAEPLTFIDFQLDLELPEDTLSLNYRDDNRIQLVTPAALIGREFDTVILVGMQEGIWPNLKARSSLMRAMALAEFASGRIENPKQVSRAEIFGELRMLYKALGAARNRVIFSSVESEESQISQFAAMLTDAVPEAQTFNEPALTLRGKVGEIRRRLHAETDPSRRAELLQALAVLAEQGVPGASPTQWFGARSLSTSEPLVDLAAGDVVYISPSQFEKFLDCPLHWFMASHGAREGGFEANLGTLLHKVLEEAIDETEDGLNASVESKWHTLDFESEWVERAQRKKAREMVGWLAGYLAERKVAGIEAIAREQRIEATIGQAKISGNIDRVERSADGAIQIVDLKTGSATKHRVSGMDDNAQLALYQLAYEHGGALMIPGVIEGDRLIGASLIFPGERAIRTQVSLSDESNRGLRQSWLARVENAIRGMAMSDGFFIANIGSHCHDEYSYGDCPIFLTEAVSHAG